MILVFSAIGLLLILLWTIYRINSHRKKVTRIDDLSISIGTMESTEKQPQKKERSSTPMLPKSDLLVLLFTNKDRPWRELSSSEMKKGKNLMVITRVHPDRIRKTYPGIHRIIWLDRSTAHDPQSGVTVINPTNLSGVLDEIRTSSRMKEKVDLVLFEDFEDILSSNDPERTIRFLNMIRELCRKEDFSVIVPVSYRSVRQRTRNRLQESFETVVI